MKTLLNLLLSMATYYFAAWTIVYLFALCCGAPSNLSEWILPMRIIVGGIIAPIIAAALADYVSSRE